MKTFYLLLSLFFLFVALFFLKRVKGQLGKIIQFISALQPILFSLIIGSWLVADWFTGAGFDDSVFYHLRFGFKGAGVQEFIPQIILFAVILLAGFIFTAGYIYCYRRAAASKFTKKNVVLGLSILCCAWFVNPAFMNVAGYLYINHMEKDFPLYYQPIPALAQVEKPKNLLYLYLEGLERTYLDQHLFPGLLPNLSKLEKQSISFTQVDQTVGASWTIAGMVASQCGLPLLAVFTNSDFAMNEFLPNASCLGDVLKEKGYWLEYMGGANLDFAGKGLFYKSHGFSNVAGLLELPQEPDYVNSWGLYDDTLYDLLSQRFISLSQQQQPFALFSITIGTHQPDGHIARTCKNIRYQHSDNKLLNAAHCTDYLLGKLFDKLQEDPAFANTLVVIASDHLAPPTVATTPLLERGGRKNLLMFINPHSAPAQIERRGTTLDIAPTILGYLDYGSLSMALGRDLNGKPPTLLEDFNTLEIMNQRLISWRSTIEEMFWAYPSMPSEVLVEPKNREVLLGNKHVKYPVLITYRDDAQIDEVWFSNRKIKSMTPAFYLSNSLNNTKKFLWVDRCAQIHTLAPSLKDDYNYFCYYQGSLSDKNPLYGELPEKSSLLTLKSATTAELSLVQASILRKKIAATNLIHWDSIEISYPDLPPLKPMTLGSSGKYSVNGPSFLSGLDIAKPGLFLVRLDYQRGVGKGFSWFSELVAPLNLCQQGDKRLKIMQYMNAHAHKGGRDTLFYAIIGNGNCQQEDALSQLELDLPLKMLKEISIGTPYIAVFDRDRHVVYEKSGTPQQTIGIYVNVNVLDKD